MRFEYQEQGQTAYLEYRYYKKQNIAFTHVVVPEKLSGRGIGQALVKAAFAFAAEINLPVMNYCPYVGRQMKEHPEYKKQLDKKYHPGQ